MCTIGRTSTGRNCGPGSNRRMARSSIVRGSCRRRTCLAVVWSCGLQRKCRKRESQRGGTPLGRERSSLKLLRKFESPRDVHVENSDQEIASIHNRLHIGLRKRILSQSSSTCSRAVIHD